MEAPRSSETLICYYNTAWYHKPEDDNMKHSASTYSYYLKNSWASENISDMI